MTIAIKSGSLDDFFGSLKETAAEIDEKRKLTRKNTIWVQPEDLQAILKPERIRLVRYLRDKGKIDFSELRASLGRPPAGLNHDLELLARCQLVTISRQPNPGHGVRKVIESTMAVDGIEFRAVI